MSWETKVFADEHGNSGPRDDLPGPRLGHGVRVAVRSFVPSTTRSTPHWISGQAERGRAESYDSEAIAKFRDRRHSHQRFEGKSEWPDAANGDIVKKDIR